MIPNKKTSPRVDPRYCPICRDETTDELAGPLCAACGETLIAQGYCPICEDYWRLAVGASCPKHEVVLEAAPPSPGEPCATDQPISWVTVWRFPDSLAAAAPRIRLEAEGIPTFLEGERMGSPAMYRVATGGVKLQVPTELVADARIILSQSWSLPFEDEIDDLHDAWEELAPEPGTSRRLVMKAVILFLLIAPSIVWLVARLLGAL
jgi:hypothetical protein